MGRIKEWEELTICDNFLFQKVMQNKRICKRLIEKLLGIKVKNITYPESEKSIDVSATQKSVRLDLYVETDEGVILDIEMQTTDSADSELPKRTRYYQSMIDLDVLSKGKDYEELKQSYVIFICTFDPFGHGRKQYTFSYRCQEQEDWSSVIRRQRCSSTRKARSVRLTKISTVSSLTWTPKLPKGSSRRM